MACEICQRCYYSTKDRASHRHRERTQPNGKCFVCSETNLYNSEMFQGVVFCSSCAQRIFQSCYSVRKGKRDNHQVPARRRHTSSRSRRRGEPPNSARKRGVDRSMGRVLQQSPYRESSADSYNSDDVKKFAESRSQVVADLALPVPKSNHYPYSRSNKLKTGSTEIGVSTDITQELLQEINVCFYNTAPELKGNANSVATPIPKCVSIPAPKLKDNHQISQEIHDKPICSDLRIAELGASTEIANMALRKKSVIPVIAASDNNTSSMVSFSGPMLYKNSGDSAHSQELSVNSQYNNMQEKMIDCINMRFSRMTKIPFQFFKKKILARSSLISLIMTTNRISKNGLLHRIKNVFYEELAEPRERGVKRLYSTINRRKVAYRLGWLHLDSHNPEAMYRKNIYRTTATPVIGCKHFTMSHSYRCMRDHTMRLAGPTRSQLACIRGKIKRCMIPRKNVRNTTLNMYSVQKLQQLSQQPHSELETVFQASSKSETRKKTRGKI